MNSGQSKAVDQLRDIESFSDGALELLSIVELEGYTEISVSIRCDHYRRVASGLPLRSRERFFVLIPPDFPFDPPTVSSRHKRFAGFPHVQWGSSLCLYQSPATEWNPSDGMFGYVSRLNLWLEKAALDELDSNDAPLHPPVTYRLPGSARLVIPRTNTPTFESSFWIGLACIRHVSETRSDIVDWTSLGQIPCSEPNNYGLALLLNHEMPFEFPTTVLPLLHELERGGIPRELLIAALECAVWHNDEDVPLYVIIGTRMRGVRGQGQLRQHLTAWYIPPVIAGYLRLAVGKHGTSESLQEIGVRCEKTVLDWAENAVIEWCDVREDRSEVTIRRDEGMPMNWFRGKTVALWGCGALGGHIAEHLTRAGVSRLILNDHGRVVPGLLVRQLFNDLDIGLSKVEALARRLRDIRPDLGIETNSADILKSLSFGIQCGYQVDLIIDTTGNQGILKKSEMVRTQQHVSPVPVASCVVGHRAERALLTLATARHSGGTADVVRRAKLETCNRPGLKDFLDDLWPIEPRVPFQPEPGCSDATFVGSSADIAVLAGAMLNRLAKDLSGNDDCTAVADFVTQPLLQTAGQTKSAQYQWLPDMVCEDPHCGYQVRICASAWIELQGWIAKAKRERGATVETGGVLFGERDDASNTIWVSEVLGPPPDSILSRENFICGIEGVKDANEEKRKRSRHSIHFIGLWHTHPQSEPLPSATDLGAMAKLVSAIGTSSAGCLLLILSGAYTRPSAGAFYFQRNDFHMPAAGIVIRSCAISATPRPVPEERSGRIGLALSGGGSRAIAFHLGCLRALQDRGILQKVGVMSAVSGGSVIGALYAYFAYSFDQFEEQVVDLLRRGLVKSLARNLIALPRFSESLGTFLFSGIPALAADTARIAVGANTYPPFCRWASRTTTLEATLREGFLGSTKMNQVKRDGLNVVINSCELRTGSAFRFGNLESGCWRYGKIRENDVDVARAVAASASFPVLLPAIDTHYTFINKKGMQGRKRVILTDGGVFDNLGVSCMEPGRSDEFSYNVFHPDYIICCDAGPGLLDDEAIPYWWFTRMARAFEATFRKVHDATRARMHKCLVTGELKGFVLSYLGQRDERLPYIPKNLIPREQVHDYPTDFSPVREEMIQRLAIRGEQLTRLLVDRYVPDL